MLYHEVTASSLIKVDMQGSIVESGTTNFGVNVPGFQLHAAVHAARPDIKCVIHVHTPSVLAVSIIFLKNTQQFKKFTLCSIKKGTLKVKLKKAPLKLSD
jgi:ribulose-5-phosphate 4-epimerase/fuculose-1-phosphate aldolase